MAELINLGNGKIVYVTFSDESERRDFDNIKIKDNLLTAYRWWLGRHKKKSSKTNKTPKTPPKTPPSLFDDVQVPFKKKLRAIMEEPHMFWYPKPDTPITIPGTDMSFKFGFDLRLERWAPHLYNDYLRAITREGIVGNTPGGWQYMVLPPGKNPIFRPATADEVERCLKLPDEWLQRIVIDDWGD
jgi:hypothetical protein